MESSGIFRSITGVLQGERKGKERKGMERNMRPLEITGGLQEYSRGLIFSFLLRNETPRDYRVTGRVYKLYLRLGVNLLNL
jgi:hypothetical protein